MRKNFGNMALAFLLVAVMIYLQAGAIVSRCNCTGHISVVNTLKSSRCCTKAMMTAKADKADEMGSQAVIDSAPCMTYYNQSIDPTTAGSTVDFNFSAPVQTLFAAIMPRLAMSFDILRLPKVFIPDKIPLPPRLQLSLKRCLII